MGRKHTMFACSYWWRDWSHGLMRWQKTIRPHTQKISKLAPHHTHPSLSHLRTTHCIVFILIPSLTTHASLSPLTSLSLPTSSSSTTHASLSGVGWRCDQAPPGSRPILRCCRPFVARESQHLDGGRVPGGRAAARQGGARGSDQDGATTTYDDAAPTARPRRRDHCPQRRSHDGALAALDLGGGQGLAALSISALTELASSSVVELLVVVRDAELRGQPRSTPPSCRPRHRLDRAAVFVDQEHAAAVTDVFVPILRPLPARTRPVPSPSQRGTAGFFFCCVAS